MITFELKLAPVSSKNEMGIVRKTGIMFLRADIKKYYKLAVEQLQAQAKQYGYVIPIEGDVNMEALFYPTSWRNDYLNLLSAPADALQKAGILKNDRQIKSSDGSKIVSIDKLNPRTIINITLL
jgi:Holliday junction resolvase RusA-like endonuclease